MAKSKISVKRLVILPMFFAFLLFIIIPPSYYPNTEINSGDDIFLDELDAETRAIFIAEASIVNTNRVLTESDDALITQFLESQGINFDETFGIVANVAIISPDGTTQSVSDIIGLSPLAVIDDFGNVRDLDTIQATFEAVTKDSQTSVNVDATVEFYLDDTLIKSKKLWVSDITKENKVSLSVVDSIPPSFSNRPDNFTFTLSDEGRDWVDDSEHYYRIVLTDINAELQGSDGLKKFNWSGQHIAYELKVTTDESKIVVLDEDNQAIAIFKSDGSIQSLAKAGKYYSYNCHRTSEYSGSCSHIYLQGVVPEITVFNLDGDLLVKNNGVSSTSGDVRCGKYGGCSMYGQTDGYSGVDGIPRGSEIVLKVDGQEFLVDTPLIQKNYNLTCEAKPVLSDPENRYCYKCDGGYTHYNTVNLVQHCTSNFGYSSP